MQKVGQEFIFDIILSKKGQKLQMPLFGDKITAKECLAPKDKIIKKKKIHSRVKTQTLKAFIKQNYKETYIETSRGLVTLLRPVTIETIKRNYPTAKSVYWGNSKHDVFSDITKLK